MKICCYCQQPGDLRPYGPKGAWLCYPCMKFSPERGAEAAAQLAAQLNAAGPIATIDEVGPYPGQHGPEVVRKVAEAIEKQGDTHGR